MTVTPTPAVVTVAKTPGFELVLAIIALRAIFMERGKYSHPLLEQRTKTNLDELGDQSSSRFV